MCLRDTLSNTQLRGTGLTVHYMSLLLQCSGKVILEDSRTIHIFAQGICGAKDKIQDIRCVRLCFPFVPIPMLESSDPQAT